MSYLESIGKNAKKAFEDLKGVKHKKIKKEGIKFSTIARGVSIGDNLEYTDEITLGRSIIKRVPFEQSST